MRREHVLLPSRFMDRRMHLWCFGHYGAPLVVFPSASGMAHEWEAHGMIETLADLIEGGRLKVYCSESNVGEAWTRRETDPAWRMERHLAFERYVIHELVPHVREDCHSADIPLAASGTSLGALYSANFVLRHPEIFRWALCMSGNYDITSFTDGYASSETYFNNPMAYVPNLDGEALDRVRRRVHLVLVCGQGKWEDGNIEETQRFADLLESKGISHERDIWGHDVSHQWPWWRHQARLHLVRAFGDGAR
jgi:esterase/lipase superfamily enzyme